MRRGDSLALMVVIMKSIEGGAEKFQEGRVNEKNGYGNSNVALKFLLKFLQQSRSFRQPSFRPIS